MGKDIWKCKEKDCFKCDIKTLCAKPENKWRNKMTCQHKETHQVGADTYCTDCGQDMEDHKKQKAADAFDKGVGSAGLCSVCMHDCKIVSVNPGSMQTCAKFRRLE